jgi:hypothetical protein
MSRRFLERDRSAPLAVGGTFGEGEWFVERKRGAYLVLNLHNNSGYVSAPC